MRNGKDACPYVERVRIFKKLQVSAEYADAFLKQKLDSSDFTVRLMRLAKSRFGN